MKNSFAVGFRVDKKHHVILGVTSIVPNLNGVLFRTEDGRDIQVESHEFDNNILGSMFISYDQSLENICLCNVIHDRRNKETPTMRDYYRVHGSRLL